MRKAISSDARTALDFLSSFQREDGKIPHEISQTASLVNWFKDFPYGYASADATPLYIITMNDYVAHSGDVEFARQKWDSVWKAYQFLQSTWDSHTCRKISRSDTDGWKVARCFRLIPSCTRVGWAPKLYSRSPTGGCAGKAGHTAGRRREFASEKPFLNQTFWSPDKNLFAFALDRSNQRMDIPSVLATVPMWFGLLDADKSELMLDQLSDSDHETDWGMRIISALDPRYDPSGYHYGSVWPLSQDGLRLANTAIIARLPATIIYGQTPCWLRMGRWVTWLKFFPATITSRCRRTRLTRYGLRQWSSALC